MTENIQALLNIARHIGFAKGVLRRTARGDSPEEDIALRNAADEAIEGLIAAQEEVSKLCEWTGRTGMSAKELMALINAMQRLLDEALAFCDCLPAEKHAELIKRSEECGAELLELHHKEK